jgi:hypothetical protein
MKKIVKTLSVMGVAWLMNYQAAAQAPANDDCSGAILISTAAFGKTCVTPVIASTQHATASTPDPSCTSSFNDDDVWYRFVANSESVVFRFGDAVMGTGSEAAPSIALYASACPTTTSTFLCQNVLTSGSGYRIIDGLTIGVTYYLRLWSLAGSGYMTVNFCIQDVPAAPANNECTSAMPVPVQAPAANCQGTMHASTVGATTSAASPSCALGSNNDDIWYRFTPTTKAIRLSFSNAVLETSAGNANLGYALYNSGCPSTSAAFGCRGNIGGGSGSILIAGLTPGNEYLLRFFSLGGNNYMSFDFCLIGVITADNDDCSGATLIEPVPFGVACSTSVHAGTAGGTPSAPDVSCSAGTNDDDIWYRFVASAESVVFRYSNARQIGDNGPATVSFAFYEGACPNSTSSFYCRAVNTTGEGYRIITGLTIGATYYLRLWSLDVGEPISFDFCLQNAPPASPNDDCHKATPIVTQPAGGICNTMYNASTAGATGSLPLAACDEQSTDDDIWYEFTANTSAVRLQIINAVQLTSGGHGAIGYALYAADCPTTSATMYCNAHVTGPELISGLTPGTLYYIRFFSYATNHYAAFDFCIQDVNLVANDDCITAAELSLGKGFCRWPLMGNLRNATTSVGFGPAACAPAAPTEDVWFKVKAPPTGAVLVQTSAVNNSVEDLVLEAYSGACGALTLIACDDDGNPEPSPSDRHARLVMTGLAHNQEVFIRVMAKHDIYKGAFSICAWDFLTQPPVSPGGSCTGTLAVVIDSAHGNLYAWVPVLDSSQRIVAEIYANGNALDTVKTSLFTNTSGEVRRTDGLYYLDRNVAIQPAANGAARVRLYFTKQEYDSLRRKDPLITGPASLKINKTNTGCNSAWNGTGTSISQDSIMFYGADQYIEFFTPSFSDFFVSGPGTSLPLRFISFTVTNQGAGARLQWVVEQDALIAHFEIEQSQDGIHFHTLAQKTQAAFDRAVHNTWQYSYTGIAPVTGPVFYRIKMVDANNQVLYSTIVRAGTKPVVQHMVVYPNPVKGQFALKFTQPLQIADIQLINPVGMVVQQWKNRPVNTAFMVRHLAPGVYIVQVTDTITGNVYRAGIIKQ